MATAIALAVSEEEFDEFGAFIDHEDDADHGDFGDSTHDGGSGRLRVAAEPPSNVIQMRQSRVGSVEEIPAAKKPPRKKPTAGATAFQLKIQLKGSKPPIWRRVLVPGSMRLSELHEVIQSVFEWQGYHLHSFEVSPGSTTLEKIVPTVNGQDYPCCTGGRGAAPSEDSGGVWGWAEKVEAANDPAHEEHDEIRDWLGLAAGETLDPKAFDVAEADDELDHLR
ncbi:plasmid pRiA4b ORF-3 family protein [Micrococcaceae bacterium Sec5.7]